MLRTFNKLIFLDEIYETYYLLSFTVFCLNYCIYIIFHNNLLKYKIIIFIAKHTQDYLRLLNVNVYSQTIVLLQLNTTQLYEV
jgi:hypothetical protein